MSEGAGQAPTRAPPRRPRTLALGLAGCLCIGLGTQLGEMITGGSRMASGFTTGAALVLLFLIAGGLNPALKLLRPAWALRRGELMVAHGMMMVACALPTTGLVAYHLPILILGFYYATPENEWAEVILPHVPEWMAPRDPGAVRYFFEGLPEGEAVPWDAWVLPLACWAAFFAALYLVMISVAVILRRQWMEAEHLVYPVAQVPLAMAREEPGSAVNPFFKSWLMWLGFSLPVLLTTSEALHQYDPSFPSARGLLYPGTSLPILRNTTAVGFLLSFPILGFSYLIRLDIAFGLWFFNLLAKLLLGIFRVTGIHSTEHLDFAANSPILAHQGMGAMIVLVLGGLWLARGHLKGVLRSALGRGGGADDSGEIMSYRAALLSTLGGSAFMLLFLRAGGLPLWAGATMLFIALILFVGITRIVVEGGMASCRAPLIAPNFVVSGMGTGAVGARGLTTLAYTYAWTGDIRTFVMASAAHALKLLDEARTAGGRRWVFWCLAAAVAATTTASCWIMLTLAYEYGGTNLNAGYFQHITMIPIRYLDFYLKNPAPPNWDGWMHTGLGAGVMAVLMFVRQRFLWWPLHPLGLPISATRIMDLVWFSVFLAWLAKLTILKYGGPRLFLRLRPFFLGMILGQFVVAGVWIVIDYLTGMRENMVFVI